jgi:uncharacterized RDD family membrane protein YckC
MTQLSINTTQNVNINFTAASIGERILAVLTDFVIQIAYMIVVFWGIFELLGFGDAIDDWDNWSKGAVVIIFMFPVIFYTLTLESIFEGQTLGKRLLKIKVVKIDGYQAGFGDYLIRWIFRLVDIFSNSGIIGLIAIVVSNKSQRLGDMTAGTSVITLKSNISINSTILEEIDEQYIPVYASVIQLSDNDIRIVKETFQVILKSRDLAMLTKLRHKIEAVTGIKNQSGNDYDFIRTVLKDYNYYTQKM